MAAKFAGLAERTPGLKAMAIGGSVARGLADEYSDLELSVFWEEMPSKENRKELLSKLGLMPIALKPLPESGLALIDETHLYQGFQVDIWHCDLNTTEKILTDVLEHFDSSPSKATFVENIGSCLPLLNDPLLTTWKKQANYFPRELAARIVSDQLKHLGYHNFSTHLARNELPILMGLISGIQKRIFSILLALNGKHFSSYKRMEEILSELEIVPWSGKNSFNNIYKLELAEAIEAIEKLMQETLSLVGQHLPEVDTVRVAHDLKNPVRLAFPAPPPEPKNYTKQKY